MTTQYDPGYDMRVEEIFFNIWKKRWHVDYRFLGRELRRLMQRWIDEEREGIFDTRPLPSPQYPKVEVDSEVMEVTPPAEVPEQAPSAEDEEEEIASNPPPTEDEVTPNTPNKVTSVLPDEAAPIILEEDEHVVDATNDAPTT